MHICLARNLRLELFVSGICQVEWGCDLQSEHERYLTEEAFSGNPVIVTDYPKVKGLYH